MIAIDILDTLKSGQLVAKQNLTLSQKANYLRNKPVQEYMFERMMYKVDPVYYCENVLRSHLPERRKHLHENQTALVRAIANPYIRRVSALMSRQAGKTESIASASGYLADNYPTMRIGIFTPRIQQAEVSLGRVSVFYQMNEELLNNKLVRVTRDKIELSNNSYIQAVSGSDQANIEGLTFDVIILDEAQKISDYTWSERIVPMGGATNAKLIKIGTPKFRNHFFDTFQNPSWFNVKRDWIQCAQLWALDSPALILPDYTCPGSGKMRQYSKFVFNLMPKALKQQFWPDNPETWTDGDMSIEDFKTQYLLEFVDGAGSFLTSEEIKLLSSGDFDWLDHGFIGEQYYAGIDFAGSSMEGSDFTHISVFRIGKDGEKQKVFAHEIQGESYPDQVRFIAKLFGGPNPRFNCRAIFADQTGCGAPVVQMLQQECGLKQLQGIVFNAADRFTNSGMNLKNIMFAEAKNEITQGKVKYPSKERFIESAGANSLGFYHKMLEEWSDLEYEVRGTINKRIEAPTGGHDDCPCSDVLGIFACNHGRANNGFGIKASRARLQRK